MNRTNPLFETTTTTDDGRNDGANPNRSGGGASAGAGDDAVMMIERTLADEAKRRAKAGGTMRSAMELRSDGSVRGDGKRAVFLKVDESGSSLRWGEVQGAGNPARMNRGAAFANVGRVERRGDGLVVRLVRRDGDVFEFTGKSVEEAAMWERALGAFVREYAENVGANVSLRPVGGEDEDADGAESNLDDTDDEDAGSLSRQRSTHSQGFIPEPSTPTRSMHAANDGHVMIAVSPDGGRQSERRDANAFAHTANRGGPNELGVPDFGEDESLTNKRASQTRRPMLQAEDGIDQLATAFSRSARLTRCDISDIGSERSSDRSDFSDDDDGGSSWGGSSAGNDSMVIEAFSRARHGRVKELQKLFSSGVDPRVRDGNGLTLLHIACQNNQRRSAKLVLKSTDYKSKPPRLEMIDAQTNNGHTALHFCFAYGYGALGEYLLSLGASDTLVNVHGLSCYEGLEPNDARETLNTPEMRARAHESRMQRWIESQRPGASHDGYASHAPSVRSAGSAEPAFRRNEPHYGYDIPRQRSEPGYPVARSRSNSEYSDDRSHASYDYADGRGPPPHPAYDYGSRQRMPHERHPSMDAHYGAHPPPHQPYMPMPYAYAAPMMPVQPMYVYPGMPPPPGYHGAYDDRRRYRSRSRDRDRRDRSRSRDSRYRERSRERSRRSSRAHSLGDRSDGGTSLASDEERVGGRRSSRYSSKASTPSRDRRRRPARVDVIEVTRGSSNGAASMKMSNGGFYSDSD